MISGSNIFRVNSDKADSIDWMTLLITVLLAGFGLLSIYSSTITYSSGFFNRQAVSFGIGLTVMFFVTFLPSRTIEFFSYPVYIASILSLLLVLVAGNEVNGAKSWITLGSFSFQPAELAKLGVMMALGKFLSDKRRNMQNLRDLGSATAFVLLPVLLILAQPDLGSATAIIALFLGILFWSGFDTYVLFLILSLPFILLASLKSTVFLVVLLLILIIATFFFRKKTSIAVLGIVLMIGLGISGPVVYSKLKPHQQARIDTFLDPGSDPRGKDYNLIQSKLAVGSGGLTGKGFKKGTLTQLRYIPEQWTDFIYSVPAEEFGFAGGSLILLLFLMLILRCVRSATNAASRYFGILSFGAATLIFYHVLINVGMVIGLMPIMGIPLPFLSYGGTSLIFNLTLVGILLNSYRTKKVKRSL